MSRDLEQRGKGKEYGPCKGAAELVGVVDDCGSDVLSAKTKDLNGCCVHTKLRPQVRGSSHLVCRMQTEEPREGAKIGGYAHMKNGHSECCNGRPKRFTVLACFCVLTVLLGITPNAESIG